MSATIKDIARKVGVAPSTVSRVLSGKKKYYTSETEEKVLAAARDLGYKRNQAAVELVKQKSNVIAVVVSSVKTTFAGDIINGVQEEALKNGYNIIVVYSASVDPEEQRRALMTCIERPVAGVLLLSVALTDENLHLLKNSEVPYCFVSMAFDDARPFVSSDDNVIGYEATKYLISKGHRKIGIAGIDQYPFAGRSRLQGYERALKENNIVVNNDWIQIGDYSYRSGIDAMKNYGADPEITAVIAASDMVGIGILNEARDLGLKVPENISIMSIDGTDMCEIVQPKLTSVTQNFYQMGKYGALQIMNPTKIDIQKFIGITIEERQSIKNLNED